MFLFVWLWVQKKSTPDQIRQIKRDYKEKIVLFTFPVLFVTFGNEQIILFLYIESMSLINFQGEKLIHELKCPRIILFQKIHSMFLFLLMIKNWRKRNSPDGWVFRSKWALSNSRACGVNDVRRFRFFDGSTPMKSVKWLWPLL